MAVSSKGFLISTSVSIVSGTKTINLTGDVDCSNVSSGTAIFLDGSKYMVEGVSGTAADPDGNSTITLRNTFTKDSLSGVTFTAFNTIEGLRDAIQRARELADGFSNQQLISLLTSAEDFVLLDFNGTGVTVVPYQVLANKVNQLETESFDAGGY